MALRATIAVALSLAATGAAFAQSYPDRTVKILVGYPAGGPVDIIARVVGDRLAAQWSKPVVVENVPGAAGNIAGDRMAHAAPDGYTLMMATNATVAINPSLYAKMSYDPGKDFVPISEAVYSPNILVVPTALPVKSVTELVDYARAHPGLTFASAGVGTTQHLAGELFKAMAHIDIRHVPYRGASPVIPDLLAGRVDMHFGAISPLIPLVREGKLRALAVTSAKRFATVPDLPTMIEAGYPGFVSVLAMGLMAPAGTPQAVIEAIHQSSVRALSDADVRARLSNIGMEVVNSSPKEFAAALAAERPQWAKVIAEAGIVPAK
ncbi:MAG TPA: tripartite tricarboxylate transporter substrate binding protein [Pseudolabrys sp.]|nr:tripartite tricarboxylate transporter substrate binding protein [Pseudolabrys sp.]